LLVILVYLSKKEMSQKNNLKQFNIVIVGIGGQGLISLIQIISEAALLEGYEVKTSELHGLSQRGGSVETHVRFGKTIYSPLVCQGGADLILVLEMQESLRATYYANSESVFLMNKLLIPILEEKNLSEDEIIKSLKKFSSKIILIPAQDILKKELNNAVTTGVFMLSYAMAKNLIPLKKDSVLQAIKKIIPEKHWEINQKTFELAKL